MFSRVSLLVLLFVLPSLLSCSALVKAAKVGSKVGKGTTAVAKGASVAGKGASAAKGAGAAGAVVLADDVAKAASHGDELFRLGRAGADAVAAKADDLTVVVEEVARHGDTVAKESKYAKAAKEASQSLAEELISNADFVEWFEGGDYELEEGLQPGDGAPEEVAASLVELAAGGQALNAAHQVGDRYWAQWVRMETGDRLAVYDTQTKQGLLLKPKTQGG